MKNFTQEERDAILHVLRIKDEEYLKSQEDNRRYPYAREYHDAGHLDYSINQHVKLSLGQIKTRLKVLEDEGVVLTNSSYGAKHYRIRREGEESPKPKGVSLISKMICIPDIGTEITLTEDWTFHLFGEYRNTSLMEALDLKCKSESRWSYYATDNKKCWLVTFPAGTQLKVNRVYIRQGNKDYSSVTFIVVHHRDKSLKGKRFWAKLADVNNMKGDVDETTFPHYSFQSDATPVLT